MHIISDLMKIYPTAYLSHWLTGSVLTWYNKQSKWQASSEGDAIEILGVGRGEYFPPRLCYTVEEAIEVINEILGEQKHIEVDRKSLCEM